MMWLLGSALICQLGFMLELWLLWRHKRHTEVVAHAETKRLLLETEVIVLRFGRQKDELTVRLKAADARIQQLTEAIQCHRDERGHDRCWLDDLTLYRTIGAPPDNIELELPPLSEFISNCYTYWQKRQPGKT